MLRNKSVLSIVFSVSLIILLSAGVSGYNVDVSRIPNGQVFSCDTCHGSMYSLNFFGIHYENEGRQWTLALAEMDSDSDGFTNGAELQDPTGAWSEGQADPGDPGDVTNPGDSASHPPEPTVTPTPTVPAGTPTNTPAPTNTPEPTNTPPGPTATPGMCDRTGVVIEMPATSYKPGDTFFTNVQFCYMEDGPFEELPVFMILDVYGALFFAPSFSETLDYYMIDTAMTTELLIEVLPPFAWPAGAGEAQGITWIAAITDPGISMLIGEMDLATFSWEE